MGKYKVGDVTPNGFEVLEVNHYPSYKMRKRIRITTDYFWSGDEKVHSKDIMGYYYIQDAHAWIETDEGQRTNLRESEFEWVD